jgi:hypothetical protein
MVFVALISWIMTVSAGLYLLVIWLIEYDISAPGGAITGLPRTVISGHGLLASSGLPAFSTVTLVLLTVLGVGGS